MLEQYRTVCRAGFGEMVIDKSIFIGYATPISSEDEALSFIQTVKKKHRDATHHVPAYVVGEQSQIQRCHDDGEPSGTAGVPILEVLKKEDLRNVAVVVVRYFGGIKLGTGGLVRAYTKGAKLALEAAEIVTRVLYQVMSVTIDYGQLGTVQNQLRLGNYAVKDTIYDEAVHLLVWVKVNQTAPFSQTCIQWTNGRCVLKALEYEYRSMAKNPE